MSPLKNKGYGAAKPGRTDVGGNTANSTAPKRGPGIGGNTPNTGGHKGQQHIYQGGNYANGAKLNR